MSFNLTPALKAGLEEIMEPLATINAAKIEFTAIAVELSNPQGPDDFERLLENTSRAKQEIAQQTTLAREELKKARRELEEGLESKREALKDELKKGRRRKEEDEDELGKKDVEAANQDGNAQFGADRVKKAAAFQAVVVAGALLPNGFKRQLGATLMASGKTENALNGLLINGGVRPTEILKNSLESLGGMGAMWNLEHTALGDLQKLFLESGLEESQAADLLANLQNGDLTLDKVLLTVREADNIAAAQGGQMSNFLTATPAGLNSFGQYLMSLGLSTQTVQAVTSNLAPGESFSSSDLRALLSESGEILAPALGQGDLSSLFAAFKAMGADQTSLSQLAAFLGQNPGQASLDDLVGFMSFLEQPSPNVLSAQQTAQSIQNLLAQTSKEAQLVKEPLFNEIVLKLAALGDKEISSDFNSLSPALQALRGGVSSWREGGDFNQGGQNQGQDRQERQMALNGVRSDTLVRGLPDPLFQSKLAEATLGYGAGETLAKQLEQKLLYTARRGIHRLKMDLEPESLGHLDVELKVKGDKLTANIRAESLEAYEALEKEMSALKDSLQAAGLELSMTLSFDGKDGRSYARSGSKYGQDKDSDPESAEDSDDPVTAETIPGGRLFDKVV